MTLIELTDAISQLIFHDAARDSNSPAARVKPQKRRAIAMQLARESRSHPDSIRQRVEEILENNPDWAVFTPAAKRVLEIMNSDARSDKNSAAGRTRPDLRLDIAKRLSRDGIIDVHAIRSRLSELLQKNPHFIQTIKPTCNNAQ